MKYKLLSFIAAAMVIFGASAGFAGGAMHNNMSQKPISKVSEVNNAANDSIIYIQGYLTQDMGNEMYMFQDDTGTIAIEIDEDLMGSNTVSPDTMVWIAAEVDKDGNVVELEAEEIQFMPNNNMAATSANK